MPDLSSLIFVKPSDNFFVIIFPCLITTSKEIVGKRRQSGQKNHWKGVVWGFLPAMLPVNDLREKGSSTDTLCFEIERETFNKDVINTSFNLYWTTHLVNYPN